MNSFLVAAQAVLPITAMMVIGYVTKRLNAVKEASFKDFNWVVFHYCLPMTLFQNVLNADLGKIADIRIFVYTLALMLAIIAVSMYVVNKLSLPDKQAGVIVQALYRTNFAILGIPLVESVCGSESTAITSLMIAICLPFFNVMAVLVLQKYSGQKKDMKDTLKTVLTNPMIIGALCGLLVKFLHIPFTGVPKDIVKMITQMTTPLSLFVLGGSIREEAVKGNLNKLVWVTIVRLIVIPVIAVTGAVLMGYRGVELVTILVLFGAPTAVSSYPMAAQMGLDGELAAQCILVTTLFVMFSMFLFISFLGLAGLL